MYYAETQNKYCFKYLDVFSIMKPNLAHLINWKLCEKKYFTKFCNWSNHSTGVPRTDQTVSNNGPYA
jgi:hypothetical protein